MKKALLLLLPLILGLGACSNKKESNNPETPETPEVPDTPVTPDWGETATTTIVFKGDKTRSGLGKGSQLGTSAFDTALTNLINEQSDNSLDALGGDKCSTQLVGGDSSSYTSLTIGTGKYNGLIYFKFDLDIVKIDANIQGYYNPHHDYEQDKDVLGIDLNAELTICSYDISEGVKESKEINLATTDDTTIPSERNESLELKESTDTIAFYNNAAAHRTFIHSLTITYLAE